MRQLLGSVDLFVLSLFAAPCELPTRRLWRRNTRICATAQSALSNRALMRFDELMERRTAV